MRASRTGIAVLTTGLFAALLPACQQHASPGGAAAPAAAGQEAASTAPGVAWFKGDVDAAFAEASRVNKPVFLYWGASWCPPCHELKATVFSRPDFIAKSRLFVTVYLDGDEPGAQKWGEIFKVRGYPSVVILKPDRTELARISGGMDLSLYGESLDLALGDVRPAQALLAALKTSSGSLSRDDCRRLAYNAWEALDTATGAASAQRAEDLERAAERCPVDARLERARLTIAATSAQAAAEKDAVKARQPLSPRLKDLVGRVQSILADTELARGCADALESIDDSYFPAARQAARTDATDLEHAWMTAMDAAAADPRYSEADHLDAMITKLAAVRALDSSDAIPKELVQEAYARIDAALARTTEEHARTSVVNSALNAFEVLGDDERASELLKQQMAISKSPYYYMDDLADLAEKHGHTDEAVQWFERGYRESEGAATRFQWGTNYVLGLLRMRPAEDERIRTAALSVLGELDGPDRIYQRTRMRLQRLDSGLRKWSEQGGHDATIAVLRKRMDDICAKIPEGEAAHPTCAAFLHSA